METLLFLIALLYAVYMAYMLIVFIQTPKFKPQFTESLCEISVVIPFRNEEKTLMANLQSLATQNFPKNKFEIVLVNDNSDDNSLQIIENFALQHPDIQLQIIYLSAQTYPSKKIAIEKGVRAAKYSLILQSDADTISAKNRLLSIASYYDKMQFKFLIGSVLYKNAHSLFAKFQELELISLQGISASAAISANAFLCNGANIAYEKQAYLEALGNQKHTQISSGDDVFLLQALQKLYPRHIHFIKSTDSLCYTYTESSVQNFFLQRLRWSYKTGKINSAFAYISAIVMLSNILLPLTIFIWPAKFVGMCICIKAISDFIALQVYTRYFKRSHLMVVFLPAFVFYYCYILLLLILPFFVKQSWKNRPLIT